jgi:hypothetical protein
MQNICAEVSTNLKLGHCKTLLHDQSTKETSF